MSAHSSSNRTWSCEGEVGHGRVCKWKQKEGYPTDIFVIIIALVVLAAGVDVVDDGEQKGKW
jgi:hypothetical protein